jgi:hypothetical protein
MVLKSQPGAELSCRAQNYRFDHNGTKLERGVISYYAIKALPGATSVESWLRLISELSNLDISRGSLRRSYQPFLQILGDESAMAPGEMRSQER